MDAKSSVESKERDAGTTSTAISYCGKERGGAGVLVFARLSGSETFLNFLVQLLVGCLLVMCLTVRWVQRAWSKKLHRLEQLAFEEWIGALMVLQIAFIVPPCRTKTQKSRAHLILAVC